MDNLSIMTIRGVKCYEKDGVAWLDLETVARGLGFTQVTNKNGTDYKTVRWERVNQYLKEIGVSTNGNNVPTYGHGSNSTDVSNRFTHLWGKGDYIPENVFYRLAMKAKNETAERFQALIADEIIPSIRKTGSYQAKPMTQLEVLAGAVQEMVKIEARVKTLEANQKLLDDRITVAAEMVNAPLASADEWRDSAKHSLSTIVQERGLNYQTYIGSLYRRLEQRLERLGLLNSFREAEAGR